MPHSSTGSVSNQSTEKALAILEHLSFSPTPVKALDVAKALGMNSSTVLRFLSALENCGYVVRNPADCTYIASTKICELANAIISKHISPIISHSFLEEISSFTKETICLTIFQDNRVFYLDSALSQSHSLVNIHQIGSTAPLFCTASGKMFLTNFDDSYLADYVENNELPKLTSSALTTYDELAEEIRTIRQHGYSVDNEESEYGVRCLAYPIRDSSGVVVYCISITGPLTRVTDDYISDVLPYLAQRAKIIETKLQTERLGFQK